MARKTVKDYPCDWKEISLKIKKRDKWQCQKCGLQFKETDKFKIDKRGKRQTLTVHHKDRKPMNCNDDNLITLCSRCHCQEELPMIREEIKARKRKEEKLKGQKFFFEEL